MYFFLFFQRYVETWYKARNYPLNLIKLKKKYGQYYDGRPAVSALWSCTVNILHGKSALWRPLLSTGSWLGSNTRIGVAIRNVLIINNLLIAKLENQWIGASKVPETGRRTAVRPVAYRRKTGDVTPKSRWHFAERPMAFRRKIGTTMEKWEFLFDFGYFSLQNDEKCLTVFCKLISRRPLDPVVGKVTVFFCKNK